MYSIGIYRHGKIVYEQNAREKVLCQESEMIPVAAISANISKLNQSKFQAKNE